MPKIFAPLAHSLILAGAVASTAHAKIDFKKDILPIIEGRCLKCHKGPHEENGKMLKPKGDIRLDAAWAMLKGNKDTVPVKPGDVGKSGMVEVVTLPKDDDKFMPPEGKGDPLNDAEIAKLKEWIKDGADFGGWEGNLEGKPVDPSAPAPKAPPKDREHDLLYKKLSAGVKPVPDDVLKKVAAGGAQISPLMAGSPLLHVDFLTGVSKCNDASVASLSPIKENVAHLDLARTSITDAALKTAAEMPNLVRLDLRKAKITDAGLASLLALKHLDYINLFDTEVSDAGLATLAKIKSLKHVFLYQTQVTDAGVAQLRTALSGAEIVADVVINTPPPKPEGGKKGKKK